MFITRSSLAPDRYDCEMGHSRPESATRSVAHWVRMKKKKRSAKRARTDVHLAVLRSFRIIYGSVRQHFRNVQRSCGISGSQLWILHELTQAPGIGISELAQRLSIHQSTCSLLIEKLARAGYVRKSRSKADQRRVGLQVSGEGRRCMKRAPGPPEGLLPEAVAGLSQSQARALYKSLQSVIAELDVRVDEAADTPLSDL